MKKYIPIPGNEARVATHIKIEVRYLKGGLNYFTYKEEPRGVYVIVTPVEVKDQGGYEMESFTAFSGTKCCVKALKRKSEKAEQEVWAKIDPMCERIAKGFLAHSIIGVHSVLEEAGL